MKQNKAIYRDLTGGLTDLGGFKALCEARGEGTPPAVGEEIEFEMCSGGTIDAIASSVQYNGAEWIAMMEPKDAK